MGSEFCPLVTVTADARGAYISGKNGDVVVIVDVIDMSTTLESALEAGARAIFGASPANARAPVPVDPRRMGLVAGKISVENNLPIILVAEPRWGRKEELTKSSEKVLKGITEAGAEIVDIVPNLGSSTTKLCDFNEKVVIAVTDTGGVAFDAAYNAGGTVITGTVARTLYSKGIQPTLNAVKKSLELAQKNSKNISIIAASANSLEDVLAAQYIGQRLIEAVRTSQAAI